MYPQLTPEQIRQRCPYYSAVPKDPRMNLYYRLRILDHIIEHPESAKDFWTACSRDILFFLNTFCWTYDPRGKHTEVPFITWEFQDEAILLYNECIEQGHDGITVKSRDMGASWMHLLVFLWRWLFKHMESFLLASRTEDLVDKTEDPDCLMWKLDFVLKRLPRWLRPNYNRQHLHLYNLDRFSTIDGVSTVGDLAVGGRRTAMMLDEFSKVKEAYAIKRGTADVSNCRLFNGTPTGVNNAFHDIWKDGFTWKFRHHWTKHPFKARGLYYLKDKPRSPWYDKETERRGNPQEMAQEVDCDFLGSAYTFFGTDFLDRIERETVRPPVLIGELIFDPHTCEPIRFEETPDGRLWLWLMPTPAGGVPEDRSYVMGADISMGTGASNSALSLVDQFTNEKVAEFLHPLIDPADFAKYAVALARFFKGNQAAGGAMMIWEANGPGRTFEKKVREIGYYNIWYRHNEDHITHKVTDVPGFYKTRENGQVLFSQYREALRDGNFINRSARSIQEHREYVVDPSAGIVHSRSIGREDPTGARENHGDAVVADALAYKLMHENPILRAATEQKPAPTSFYARMQERKRERLARTKY